MTDPTGPERTRWHERTVERSLNTAKARAISRGDRFIKAAASLLRERGQPDFTVQEIVERSGMSLRSFYHHFASKDDLLLALIEETVRAHSEKVRDAVAAVDDPLDQLREFVLTYYGKVEDDDPASRGMSIFHLHLAGSRAADYTAAFEPQVELLGEILARGRKSGQIRTDIRQDSLAQFITHILVYAINMRVLGVRLVGDNLTAEELWLLVRPSVAVPGRGVASRTVASTTKPRPRRPQIKRP